MTTPQHTETEQTTYPNRVRVPRGRVTHAARVSFADSVSTSCGIFYGHEVEPRWQDDDAEVTCRACIKSEYRREQKATEQPKTDAVCTDAAGNPFTSHDFTPDGIGPKCRRCAEPQHEVTRSLNLTAAEGDEDVWDEPRAELTGAEVMTLRPGLVVEAQLGTTGRRVRVRLAATPTCPAPGIVTLRGADDAEHDVVATSVVLIGVMPRKGDTIHAQAKTYTEVKTAAELPDGARVRAAAGRHEGRSGKVIAAWAGRVDKPGHPNHGREYVGVQFDAVPGDMGAGSHSRPFVDELRLVGRSKPMRRKLDRDPWPGGPGQLVVSDGRGVDAVLTSTVVILAGVPGKQTEEQRIARAVSLAMPGLDFHTNTTSISAIRVYARRAEHESRNDEAVLARNDDIAEALRLAGFHVARRGVGQDVYASVAHSPHALDPMCAVESHKGEPAPWIAVLTTPNPFYAPYACRACVRRQVEGERALGHVDPERPYLVRMWDETGRTLKTADDPGALDFVDAASRDEARIISEDILVAGDGHGWRHEQGTSTRRRVYRVTVDRALFYRDDDLRRVERVIESNGLPEVPQPADAPTGGGVGAATGTAG